MELFVFVVKNYYIIVMLLYVLRFLYQSANPNIPLRLAVLTFTLMLCIPFKQLLCVTCLQLLYRYSLESTRLLFATLT